MESKPEAKEATGSAVREYAELLGVVILAGIVLIGLGGGGIVRRGGYAAGVILTGIGLAGLLAFAVDHLATRWIASEWATALNDRQRDRPRPSSRGPITSARLAGRGILTRATTKNAVDVRSFWFFFVVVGVYLMLLHAIGTVRHGGQVAGIVLTIIAGAAAILGVELEGSIQSSSSTAAPAEDRIVVLTRELQRAAETIAQSSVVIAEIESEVAARRELAARLREDVERYQELMRLREAEVEAVALTLRKEVARGSRQSLLFGILVNGFFFGSGILLTLVLK